MSSKKKPTTATDESAADAIDDVDDDAELDDTVSQARYDITSYGIDFDVDGIVRRLKKNQIRVPSLPASTMCSSG
jgi:hypothetical protein